MQTRRRAQAEAWIAQLEGAAELPSEVQQVILQHTIATVAAAAPVSDASVPATGKSFAQLDSLRRVCKRWDGIISSSPAFLDLFWTEKLCSLERMAWTRSHVNNKRLPSSFSLPYLQHKSSSSNSSLQDCSRQLQDSSHSTGSSSSSSSDTHCLWEVVNVRFKLNKSHKRAALFVAEPNPRTCSPQQAVALLHKMCELEGSKMAMLLLLQCPADTPQDWLQQLKAGAAAIHSPTTLNVFQRADGVVFLHPKNEQHKCYLKPRS
jgi:hypothetical protein